ncbi:MAG TPA: hypothetical protein VGI90_12150 [Steroidobacteraceae bacterium]
MTIRNPLLRSIVEPLWEEFSSLWSGIEFSFYDPLNAEAGFEQEVSAVNRVEAALPNARAGTAAGRFERCW